MSYRRLMIIALLAGLPEVGGAQFTTFIPPKNKVADSVKAVVAEQQKAKVDSSVKQQLTDMKTWVDSAAGVAPLRTPSPSSAANDTLAAKLPAAPTKPATRVARTQPLPPPPPVIKTPDTTRFVNGARAPSTATDLPTLLVLGGLLIFTGATLVGAKPKPERVRTNRSRSSAPPSRTDSRA